MEQRVTPQLRSTSWERTRAFYEDGLGFHVEWEHRFAPGFSVIAQVSRDSLSLFLTEKELAVNDEGSPEYARRTEIALRNRRRKLDDKVRKFTMAVFGLAAYSAAANLAAGIFVLVSSPIDAGFGLVLGSLYAFAAYRVWIKDDTRWWPVVVPAAITIVFAAIAWLGGMRAPGPLVFNVALLISAQLRRRASAQLAAVPNQP